MELAFSFILLGLAAGIWYVFIRPVPLHQASGQVIDMIYKPAGKYWQYQPSGTQRGFNTPTAITTNEGYILTIRIDGVATLGKALVSKLDKDTYRVGDQVKVEYVQRGVPGIWARINIIKVAITEKA